VIDVIVENIESVPGLAITLVVPPGYPGVPAPDPPAPTVIGVPKALI
jgi:hypothetical protein